jgi:hypothetical protein
MALRGRPASDSPQKLVEEAAGRASISIPGDKDERGNRLQGLGSLSGIAVGVTVGAVAGLVHQVLARRGRVLPAVVGVPLLSATAMALSDVPLKLLGVSDPATWAPKAWVSDAVPQLLYGAVTHSVLQES